MSRKQHFTIRPFISIYLIYICRALLTSTSSSNNYLRLSIIEEVPAGSYVGSVIVNGDSSRRPSPETSSRLTYRILTTPALPFSVENRTGKIYTEGSIDRDSLMLCKDKATCEVQLDVTVKNEKYFEIVKVIVEILDINDNEPYFKDKSATIFIRESVSIGTTFQLPIAYDLDGPKYAVKLYKLSECSTNNVGLKVLRREDSSLDPRLVVMSALDRETEEEYSAKLTAYDGGEPAKSTSIDLKIVIADANDNKPVFEKTIYEINVNEDVKVGSIIAKIKAHDKDVGENGIVTYQLLDQVYNTYGSTFAIDRSSGYLKVNSKLDRETISIYHLTVLAEDQGPGSVAVDAKVVVRVLDVNDNKPKIIISTLTSRDTEVTEVWENQTGSFVAHVTVTDPDNGVNGTVRCSFVLKNKNSHEKNDNNFQKTNNSDKEKTSHMLRVHSMFQLVKRYNTEYQIILNGSLDREECSSYALKLTCEDEGAPTQRSHKSLEIIVKDVNDNPPVFEKEIYVVDVLENNFINQKFLKLVVSDADQEPSNFIQFFSSLVNVTPSSPSSSSSSSSSPTQVSSSSLPTYVKIDEHGNMYLTEVLDRESIEMLSIQVLAVDSGTIRLTATASVHVIVGDVNDEKPQFINADNENRHSVNDKFFENIITNGKHHFFDNYNATLTYPLYVFHVEENNEPNTAIGQILAVDRDVSASNNVVTYWFNTGPPSFASSIIPSSSSSSTMSTKLSYDGLNEERVYLNNRSGLFELDSASGVLRVTVGLDREDQSVFKLSVVAVDSGRPTQMAHCDVTIHVADLNDNDPVFEKFTVHQSQLVVKYKQKNVIEQQNEKQLTVDQLLLRHPMNETHYEMFPSQNVFAEHLSVGAFDNNTNRPVIYISPMTPVNKIIFKTLASDADRGDNAKITYSMQYKNISDEGYFEINKNNGIVSVQKLLSNILHKEVTIILRATDRGLPARWTEAVIEVVINHTVPYNQHFYDYSGRAEDDYQIGSKAGQEPAIQYMDLYWIVFIVVLSVITISTLLTAVVIFKQRNNKKKQSQRFKSRMEALKALTTKEITNSNNANNNSFSSSNILAESVPLNANNLSKRSSECKFERQGMKMMDVDRDTKDRDTGQARVSSKIPQCPDRPYVFIKNISPSSCFEFKTATFTTKLDALPEDNQNFNILNATKGITTSHYNNNTMPLSSSISSTNLCKNNNNDPQFNSLTFDQNGNDGNNYCCCPSDVELCNNEMNAIAMKNIHSKSLTRKLNKSTKQHSTQQFNCNNNYVNTLSSDTNSIIEDPKIVVSKVRNVVASNNNSNNDAPNYIVRAGRSEDQCTLMTRHHPHQQTHSQQNSLSDNDSCLSDTLHLFNQHQQQQEQPQQQQQQQQLQQPQPRQMIHILQHHQHQQLPEKYFQNNFNQQCLSVEHSSTFIKNDSNADISSADLDLNCNSQTQIPGKYKSILKTKSNFKMKNQNMNSSFTDAGSDTININNDPASRRSAHLGNSNAFNNEENRFNNQSNYSSSDSKSMNEILFTPKINSPKILSSPPSACNQQDYGGNTAHTNKYVQWSGQHAQQFTQHKFRTQQMQFLDQRNNSARPFANVHLSSEGNKRQLNEDDASHRNYELQQHQRQTSSSDVFKHENEKRCNNHMQSFFQISNSSLATPPSPHDSFAPAAAASSPSSLSTAKTLTPLTTSQNLAPSRSSTLLRVPAASGSHAPTNICNQTVNIIKLERLEHLV